MSKLLTPEILALIDPVVSSLKRHQLVDDKEIALTIAQLLMKVISAARWSNTYDLIELIRQVGVIFTEAYPRKVIPGNIVRRVLALIRDETETETETETEQTDNIPMMSSMFSLLATHNKNETIKEQTQLQLKKQTSDMRAIIIQGIRDLVDEISNVNDGIETMAVDLIHDDEILLTPTPNSETVQHF